MGLACSPGGVLSPFTNDRFNLRRRRVVAIIGLPERVLTFTPGVPDMAPNGLVCREKAHAELPRTASSVDGQNMSHCRSKE
jgi:hypothetical protein